METIENLNYKELANGVVVGDFCKGSKQYVFVRVDGVTRFAVLHPRYPAGHPKGGQFMPKDIASTNTTQPNTSTNTTNWEEVRGRDFRRYFKQWDNTAKKIEKYIEKYPELEDKALDIIYEIEDYQEKIDFHKAAIKQAVDRLTAEKRQTIALRKEAIAYRLAEIEKTNNADEIAAHKAKIERDKRNIEIAKKTPVILQTPSIARNRAKITQYRAKIAKQQKTLDAIENSKLKTPIKQLEDSKTLYDIFASDLKGRVLMGVKSGDNLEAAAAIIAKKDHIYIDFLMTNPKSLIEGKSKGAGTAAIKAVAKKSLESGKGGVVKLWAVDSAVPFYEKVGFTRDVPYDNYMTLSSKAAKKLLGV